MKARSLLLSFGFLIFSIHARADIVISVTEFTEPAMVKITASGSIDTTSLPLMASAFDGGGISPGDSLLRFTDPGGSSAKTAFVATGMPAFGAASFVACDYFEGDNLGFSSSRLTVPSTYVSGEALSSSVLFLGASLSSLGFDEEGAPHTATLTTGDRITIKVVNLVDQAKLFALQASSKRTERNLKKKNKKLARKLRAAKRTGP